MNNTIFFKKSSAFLLLLTLCFLLCSCGAGQIKNSRWENEWGYVEFSEEGVMTIKTDEITDTYYYIDKKGKEGNRYLLTYKTDEDMAENKDAVFIPYYIRNNELYIKGECYSPVK